jgi:uncharacterized protein
MNANRRIPMRRLGPVVPIALSLVLAFPALAAGQTTLHVVGHGRVFVTPDLAAVTITADRTGSTRLLARVRVDRVINRMIRGLVRTGVKRIDIQTTNVTLNSTVVSLKHHRHRTVWDSEIDLNVTTRSTAVLSRLFDVATRAGADTLSGPNFGFSDPSAGLPAATTAAIRDAHHRADAAAAELGMHVVGVQSVDLDPGSSPLPASGAPGSSPQSRAPGAALPKTPVLPGRQEVDVSVDIVYLLG